MSTDIYPAQITGSTFAEDRTYKYLGVDSTCILKKFVVISGGNLHFGHVIHKEKRQILRALGVVFYLGTVAQESV